MAAQNNAAYRASIQERATYPHTGYCSRCVRICIKCQQGSPQQPDVFQQQQHHPISCPCSVRSLPAYNGSACFQAERHEQVAMEYPQHENEMTASDTRFQHKVVEGNITEEATVDETTEKTSVPSPSQRGSVPSTWQETPKVGRLDTDNASEWEAQDASSLKSEVSTKELQVNMSQHETPTTSEEPNKRPVQDEPLSELRSPSRDMKKQQESSQKVTDCLQKCYEKLEEMQHQNPNGILTPPSAQVSQSNTRDSPSQCWAGENICMYPNQSAITSEIEDIAVVCAPEKVVCLEEQSNNKYSPKPPGSEITAPNRVTSRVSGLPHSDSLENQSELSKTQQSKTNSNVSKRPQASGVSDSLPSDSSRRTRELKDRFTNSELYPPTIGPTGFQSDSTVIQCKLTKDNLSLCKRACEKMQHKLQGNTEVSEHQETLLAPQTLSGTIKSSQSASHQRELLDSFETERELARNNVLKKSASQQEWASNKSASQQESDSKGTVSKQWLDSKTTSSGQALVVNSSASDEKTIPEHDWNSRRSKSPKETDSTKDKSQKDSILERPGSQTGKPSKWSSPQQDGSSKKLTPKKGSGSERSDISKQTFSQPSEPRTRSVSRTPTSEKLSDLLSKKSEQSKEKCLQPATEQSSKQCVGFLMENQELQTEATARSLSKRISEVSDTPRPSDENKTSVRDLSTLKSDLSKSGMSALLPGDRKMSTASKTTSEAASQTSVVKTPLIGDDVVIQTPDKAEGSPGNMGKEIEQEMLDKGKMPDELKRETLDKGNIMSTPSSQSMLLAKKPYLGKEKASKKALDKEKTPDQTKTLNKKKILETPNEESRLSADSSQTSSQRKQSSSNPRSPTSASSDKSDQTCLKNWPHPCCLRAFYLPLFQCAYCQRITPYPLSCQTGLVSCCPSPYDPCQCYAPSPCARQGFPLCYPQPCSLEYSGSDHLSQTNQFEPVILYPYVNDQASFEPAKPYSQQTKTSQEQSLESDESCTRPTEPCPQPCPQPAESCYEPKQLSCKQTETCQQPSCEPPTPCQQPCSKPDEPYSQPSPQQSSEAVNQSPKQSSKPSEDSSSLAFKSTASSSKSAELTTKSAAKSSKPPAQSKQPKSKPDAPSGKTTGQYPQSIKPLWSDPNDPCCQQLAEPCCQPTDPCQQLCPDSNKAPSRSYDKLSSDAVKQSSEPAALSSGSSKRPTKPSELTSKPVVPSSTAPFSHESEQCPKECPQSNQQPYCPVTESCQQTCPPPTEPCSTVAEACPNTNQDIPPLTCDNKSSSCLTCSECSVGQATCQACDQPCQTTESGDGRNREGSINSAPSDFLSSNSAKMSVLSRDDGEHTHRDPQGKDTEPSPLGRGSETSSNRNSEKQDDSDIENDRAKHEGSVKDSNKGEKTEKIQGYNEIPRRRIATRKDSHDDKAYLEKKQGADFRRGKVGNRSEDIRRRGSVTRSQRSSLRPASADTTSMDTSKPTTPEDGKSRKRRTFDGEGKSGRRADTKTLRAKTARSLGQTLFERVGAVAPVGVQKNTTRSTRYPLSPSFISTLSPTKLRKLQLASSRKYARNDKTPLLKSSSLTTRSSKATSETTSSPQAEHLPDSKISTLRWGSSVPQDRFSHKHRPQHSQPRNSFPRDETTETSITDTKCHMNAKTPPYSEIPTPADGATGSNESAPSCSRRCTYPDRDKHRNIYSPYLSPKGAPHRAISSAKRHTAARRLVLDNPAALPSARPTFQRQVPQGRDPTPLSSCSGLSNDEESASPRLEDLNYGPWQESPCSCTEWINRTPFPEYYNCCPHVWANAAAYVCPLNSQHMCHMPSFSTSGRRRHTKAKPLSHRSQIARRIQGSPKPR